VHLLRMWRHTFSVGEAMTDKRGWSTPEFVEGVIVALLFLVAIASLIVRGL